MKCSNKALCLFSILILASCSAGEQVTWGDSFSWRQLLNAHESPKRWIKVAGKRYYYPRGVPPYYVNIPEIDGIFFVTEDRPGTDFKCHFYLLKERRDIVFQMQSGYLGGGIGAPQGASFSDRIEAAKWPLVTVTHKAETNLTIFNFNLQDGTAIVRK